MVMLTRIGSPGLTANRLDPTYYRPDHLRDAQLRAAWTRATLDELKSPSAPIVYGVLKPDDQGEKYRVAKAERFDGMFISAEDCDPIGEAMFHEFGRAEAIDGDLLVAIGGYVGRPAMLRVDGHLRVVVNRHLARVRIDKSRGDSGWVLAYFSSALGERQLIREITGSVQAGINLCDLRLVDVPLPVVEVQHYIGDKVRQAERLRERARRLEAAFRSAVTVAIPSSSSMAGKTSRIEIGELGRNLNAGAYAPDRRAVRTAVRVAGGRSLDTLADVENPTTASYSANTPYLGLDAIDSATCGLRPSTAAAESVAGTARLLREGPALSRLRPYLNKATYIPASLAGGIGSTELLLVRPKAGVDGWFLYGVLKLESSIRQLNPVATGSTHPRVDRDDVLDLLVPWRDEHTVLGEKLRTAQACYFGSTALTSTATTLVEQLIDGRLNEADLVAAQSALEGGDRGADREILQSLRQSDAPDAKPLIADVDALDALIDGSEGQDP